MGIPATTLPNFNPTDALNAIPESIVEGIIMADKECRILFVNQAACQMLGYTKEEMIGQIDHELLIPENHKREFLDRKKSRYLGSKDSYEIGLLKKNGEIRYFRVHGSLLINRNGEALGTCGTIFDISEERKLRLHIEHQKEQYQTIFNSVPAMIFFKDTKNRILDVNAAALSTLGMTRDELVAQSVNDIRPNEASLYYQDDLEVIQSKMPKYGIVKPFTTKNGEKRWMRADKLPIKNSMGDIIGIIVFGVDITQEKRTEEEALSLQWQLLNAQKMEAIGQLAAGIAHDLNNSLTAVVGHLELVLLNKNRDPDITSSTSLALEGIDRAADLVRQLLAFSRQGAYNIEKIDLISTVSNIIEFLSSTIDPKVSITLSCLTSSAFIKVDRTQFSNALTNLIINATHSMSHSGSIFISLANTHVANPQRFNPTAVSGEFYHLSVKDNGCGIPSNILPRIFEPFFTTKDSSEGTGLGLALVYGFMQRMGGWVEVTSEVNKGSTFSLYFPTSTESEDRISKAPTHNNSREVQTALVIDDETMIGEMSAKFLERANIRSTVFQDPRKAIEWYAKNHKNVNLIVLDMKMPGIDGATCFKLIKQIREDANVVLFSGFMCDDKVQKILEQGALRFFQKPIQYGELIGWIKENVSVKEQP